MPAHGVQVISLTQNMHVINNPVGQQFSDDLLAIGNGERLTVVHKGHGDYVQIDNKFIFPPLDPQDTEAGHRYHQDIIDNDEYAQEKYLI